MKEAVYLLGSLKPLKSQICSSQNIKLNAHTVDKEKINQSNQIEMHSFVSRSCIHIGLTHWVCGISSTRM